MIRRTLSVVLLTVLLSAPSFAGSLTKFKDWGSSPQAYFMTASERAEWANVKSDEEAQRFVDAFLARRPPTFPAEVAKRADMADKYLSMDKMPGSKTLRGKTIILLGPPSSMDVSVTQPGSGTHLDNQAYTSAAASSGGGRGGAGGGLSTDDLAGTSGGAYVDAAKASKYYTFVFRGDSAHLINKDEVTINVQADPSTGKDRLTFRSAAGEVDQLFEAAAKASLAHP